MRRNMRLLPAILIAIALLLAPVVWHFSRSLFFPTAGSFGGMVDDTARIELERLRAETAVLRQRIEELEKLTMGAISVPPPTDETPDAATNLEVGDLLRSDENTIADDYPKVVLIENRRRLNKGLTLASSAYLKQVFGLPNENLSDTCGKVTNAKLSSKLVLAEIGKIKARLLEPAVDSLRRIFSQIRAIDDDLYERVRSSGALCVRRIRGSSGAVSTHAYGLAIDLNVDGQLDTLGDGRTQLGLTILADIFQREGWFWGASFGREDSMHFEVSRELLDQWIAQGKI